LEASDSTNGNYTGAITNNAILIYSSASAQDIVGYLSGSGTLNENGPGHVNAHQCKPRSQATPSSMAEHWRCPARVRRQFQHHHRPQGHLMHPLDRTAYTMGARRLQQPARARQSKRFRRQREHGFAPNCTELHGSTPALTISQGSLLLNGNVFTINGAPLAWALHD